MLCEYPGTQKGSELLMVTQLVSGRGQLKPIILPLCVQLPALLYPKVRILLFWNSSQAIPSLSRVPTILFFLREVHKAMASNCPGSRWRFHILTETQHESYVGQILRSWLSPIFMTLWVRSLCHLCWNVCPTPFSAQVLSITFQWL